MTGALFFGYAVPFADIGAAFVAKELCSRVFLSGRTPAAIKREDFDAYPSFGLFDAVRWQIDRGAGSVETFAPFGTARAVFRPGLGCAVVPTGAAAAAIEAVRGAGYRFRPSA